MAMLRGMSPFGRGELHEREREDARRGRPAAEPLRDTATAPAGCRRAASFATPATARAIARHGLKARNTSPSSTLAAANPSQKIT